MQVLCSPSCIVCVIHHNIQKRNLTSTMPGTRTCHKEEDTLYKGMPEFLECKPSYNTDSSFSETDKDDDETLCTYEQWEEECLDEMKVLDENVNKNELTNGPHQLYD